MKIKFHKILLQKKFCWEELEIVLLFYYFKYIWNIALILINEIIDSFIRFNTITNINNTLLMCKCFILYITIDLIFHLLPAWYLTINQTKYEIIVETQPSLKKSNIIFTFQRDEISLEAILSSVISSELDWLCGKDQKTAVTICGCADKNMERTKACSDTRALSAARWSHDDNSPARRSVSLIIDTRS